MIYRIVIFLIINFSALAIGAYFTGDGVPSEWYQELSKAPWTPPGWFFGFAWTSIMICFSIYLAYLSKLGKNLNPIIVLFIIQWILNIIWNPIFFYFQNAALGLIVITALSFVIGKFLFKYHKTMRLKSALILPYFIWIIIATSLNAYIVIYN